MMGRCVVDSCNSEQGLMVHSWKNGSKPSSDIKSKAFLSNQVTVSFSRRILCHAVS